MKQYVITISRQFASLGRPVAQSLSEKLGIEFWDRDIVEETAKRMKESVTVISDAEESARSAFSLLRQKYRMSLPTYNITDEIFEIQKNIIRDVASKESCIILGRCGDSILKDFTNTFHVYLYAPYEYRLKNCIEVYQMEEREAAKMIRNVDLSRRYYQKRYCPETKSIFDYKDMMLDVSKFGVDGTAEIIAGIAKRKFE